MTGVAREEVGVRLGAALCEAWGLNPREVLRIVIDFKAHDLPRATIHTLLNEQVIKHVLELVPRDGLPD